MRLTKSIEEMLPTIPKDSEIKDGEGKNLIKIVERPTFILKTREGENRAVSPSQRNGHKYSIFKYLITISILFYLLL